MGICVQKITFVKYLFCLNSYVSNCICQGNLCFWDSGPLLQKSQSTIFPGEISDLGTLVLSSRSLKVLYFLGKSLIWGLWPLPPAALYNFLATSLFLFPLFGVACNTPTKRPKYAIGTPGNSKIKSFASELASLSPLNLQMLEIPVSGGISGEVSRANAMVSLPSQCPKCLICQHFGGIIRNWAGLFVPSEPPSAGNSSIWGHFSN